MLGNWQVLFLRGTHRVWGSLWFWVPGTLEPLAPLGLQQPPRHPGLRSSYSRAKQPIWRTCVRGKREGHPFSSGSPSSEGSGRGQVEANLCFIKSSLEQAAEHTEALSVPLL